MYETIHDVNVLQKSLMQTWYDWPVARPSDIMYACWWWTLEYMLWNECSFT